MITPTSSSIFEPIVNVRLLNNPLFIGCDASDVTKIGHRRAKVLVWKHEEREQRMTSSALSVKIFSPS